MTRRDIIIIAVLANVAVLAILFMLAFRTDDDKVMEDPEIAYTIVEDKTTPLRAAEIERERAEPADEVDNVLEEVTPINTSRSNFSEEENLQFLDAEQTLPITRFHNEGSDTVTQNAPIHYAEVTVKHGDALEKIARANGTTVNAIMKTNNLMNDHLKIGQKLRVPMNTNTRAPLGSPRSNMPPQSLAQTDIQYYIMNSGDNPWKIAKQFNMKVDELLKLNNLDEDSARRLKTGDQIRIK